ncbi:HYC_CC_PP family protein [Dyadobacter frigoris]|uniref:Uncharacterized protein n=1 Tax=Dyadobacter frigoris TaxID=2576211 RepID=A0A4U6CYY5_9BACT|nr:hypothetical protein [Dyadobacter frigoris]TKT86644.1 hypothetical protein FDK13_31860 [Dyadobacter frigoris]
MKNKLHRSITILMAVLVLISSTGFGLTEHQCLMQGMTMKFVSEKKADSCKEKVVSACCAKSNALKESKKNFLKKTDCCKDQQKFEKVDVVSSIAQLHAKALKMVADGDLWSVQSFVFLLQEWVYPPAQSSLHTISFSSLFHGRSMLSFVQSFLI